MPFHRTYDARAVANYFLELAGQEGKPLDPMGIQKLVYFAHGWTLAIYDRPLISQRVEAWDYGPVIRDLYNEFKRFGSSRITEPAEIPGDESGTRFFYCPRVQESLDPETVQLLRRVWEVYKDFTSIQLSNMTHLPGSPWERAQTQGQGVIDDNLIKEYFVTQMSTNPRQSAA
jgi:uncharacterized phage-associated protein